MIPKMPHGKGKHLFKHGYSATSLYRRWCRMKQRCYDSKCKEYPHYGGRGITVCDRWLASFPNFLEDMGEPPPGGTLDRVDVNKGYSPENCRWASMAVQRRNTANLDLITFDGKTLCRADWAALIGINSYTLQWRLQNWPLEKALTTPPFNKGVRTHGLRAA